MVEPYDLFLPRCVCGLSNNKYLCRFQLLATGIDSNIYLRLSHTEFIFFSIDKLTWSPEVRLITPLDQVTLSVAALLGLQFVMLVSVR